MSVEDGLWLCDMAHSVPSLTALAAAYRAQAAELANVKLKLADLSAELDEARAYIAELEGANA